jgi:glycosyltransferase involved in cell wall biosynthesis
MTAASKGIAIAYTEKYGITRPGVILNVFPLEELPVGLVNDPVKFYWYSQVIGPNRGVELLLDAAGKIDLPFEIHLRGSMYSEEYKNELKQRCERSGIWNRIFFHDPILAEQLVSDANQFDIGLALESDISVNRNICVTNKIFSYLMSRLLVIGTDTEGQKDIFGYLGNAVSICHMNDAEDLSKAMRFYIGHKDQLLAAKQAAGQAVEHSFNWESESEKLLGYVEEVFQS